MKALARDDRSISVVLPVRNEAARIAGCIEGILAQTVAVEEILVIDSGSTDGTLEILARYPQVRVESISPQEFNHGESRNLGARLAKGEWVIFTVGDARALDSRWIEQLFAGLVDADVAAVCGVQVVPHEREANPLDWFRPVSPPGMRRVQYATSQEFESLSPAEKLFACSWDNVNALYRRSVLLEIPFRQVTYCEDAFWASDALRAGKALVYNTGARVYHYHVETTDYAFNRAIAVLYHRYRAFGHVPDESAVVSPILSDMARLILASGIPAEDKAHWLVRAPRLRIAVFRARKAFIGAIRGGDADVDELVSRCCGVPPIPGKTNRVTVG
jgi:rhamnosyltransferase